MTDAPWTLAERFDYARHLAKIGVSVDEIAKTCRLTRYTAECIVNSERPGTIDTLGRTRKET